MEGDRQKFLLFWIVFCSLAPSLLPYRYHLAKLIKIKIKNQSQNYEKMEKSLEISSFYMCVPKSMIT